MKLIEQIDFRSEEVQDVMGKIPSWILRCGNLVILFVVLLLIIGSYFFEYPDTLAANVIITNSTPPIDVVANASGNIELLNVKNKDNVRKGQVLAVVHSTSNYKDVMFLKKNLFKWIKEKETVGNIVECLANKNLQLGELQEQYLEVCQNAFKLNSFKSRKYYDRKIIGNRKKLQFDSNIDRQKEQMLKLYTEKEKILKATYLRDSTLFNLGLISAEEYEKSCIVFLQGKQEAFNCMIEVQEMKRQMLGNQENIIDLDNENDEKLELFEQDLQNSLQKMMAMILDWEQQYVMKSPIEGTVNLVGAFGKKQYVNVKDLMFVIVPTIHETSIGKAFFKADGLGKISVGQKVMVFVNNYPEEDFGYIMGLVSSVSDTPTADGLYMVDITFPNGLKTIYNKFIPSSKQLIGSAKIIIKNRRLSDWFLLPIRKIIKSQQAIKKEIYN